MEEVKNLILYQVATDRNYKVGDKLVFDKILQTDSLKEFFHLLLNLMAKDHAIFCITLQVID